ncbi:MAG: hypothetical protein V9F01_01350 [Chitinophagaceae bacterium]
MTTPATCWKYTLLLIQDPIDHGYTAFFAEFPNIIAEGDTKEEARKKLFLVADEVFELKRKNSLNDNLLKNDDYKVTIEHYNAELASA